jgi:hypothetical protein
VHSLPSLLPFFISVFRLVPILFENSAHPFANASHLKLVNLVTEYVAVHMDRYATNLDRLPLDLQQHIENYQKKFQVKIQERRKQQQQEQSSTEEDEPCKSPHLLYLVLEDIMLWLCSGPMDRAQVFFIKFGYAK